MKTPQKPFLTAQIKSHCANFPGFLHNSNSCAMRSLSALLAILCLALQPLRAEDKKPDANKPPDAKSESAKKSEDKDKPAPTTEEFNVPVPVGIPVKGIKIPHRDENGKLLMTIEAEVATKLDDEQVEMQSMKVESFDQDGKAIIITLPRSLLNLQTRLLTGNEGVRIERDDFEITGDSVEFNTKTRFATLRGNIRMIIQSENLDK
jgi:hypothetical protein